MTTTPAPNLKQFNHFDKTLRDLVEAEYDLCLYKCNESYDGFSRCKDNCVTNVIVPYRFANHAAREEEDNNYRRCLASKLPNI